MRRLVLFALISISGATSAGEVTIKLLPPSAFPELPFAIRQALERRNCAVPQIWEGWKQKRHNVIRGAFFKKRQIDWAVLCSIAGRSAIFLFPPGASQPSAELASADDKSFIQEVAPGKFGFSRIINATGRKRILEYYEEYGGRRPPPLDHQGINDAFAEKGSVIRYFFNDEWLELQGAD